MNWLLLSVDADVAVLLNEAARQTPNLDKILVYLATANILKGGVMMVVVWWLWFQRSGEIAERRIRILCTLTGLVIAITGARALTICAPFRPRPIHAPGLSLSVPFGIDPSYLGKLSSFPSDHAALFIALTVGLFYISWRMGVAALVYTLIIIVFPRLYLGLHYVSDMIVGGFIGLLVIYLVQLTRVRQLIGRIGLTLMEHHPSAFYAAMFLFSYQLVNQFDDLRTIGHFVVQAARRIYFA
jgi:undecaprenyl-diphosphatase